MNEKPKAESGVGRLCRIKTALFGIPLFDEFSNPIDTPLADLQWAIVEIEKMAKDNAVAAAEIERLRNENYRLTSLPTAETMTKESPLLKKLARLARQDHKVAKELLRDFDVYAAYVHRLDKKAGELQNELVSRELNYQAKMIECQGYLEKCISAKVIIDKLPKTEDGVSVIPGETYWCSYEWDDAWVFRECYYVGHATPHVDWDWEIRDCEWDGDECPPGFGVYSTHEVAFDAACSAATEKKP